MLVRRRGGRDDKEKEPEKPKVDIVDEKEKPKETPPDDSAAHWQMNPCNFDTILTGSFSQKPVDMGGFNGWPGKRIPVGAYLYHGGSADFAVSAVEDDNRIYFTTCKARADAIGNTTTWEVTQAIYVVYTGPRGGDHVDDKYLRPVGAYYSSKECEVVMMGDVAKASLKKYTSLFGCFLTSACVEARGLPDDCFELTVLRGFRDGYMRSLPGGPALVSEYDEIAPLIVERIHADPEGARVLEALYERVLRAVKLIVGEQPDEALTEYASMVTDLRGKYLPER